MLLKRLSFEVGMQELSSWVVTPPLTVFFWVSEKLSSVKSWFSMMPPLLNPRIAVSGLCEVDEEASDS